MLDLEKNPNPTKDQHFLIDQNILNLLRDSAEIEDGESIVEIGGGEGNLTDYLIQGNNHVTVIEKDYYYAEFLKNKYKDYSNVTIIEGDALSYNYSDYDRIISNLPYTITEQLFINLAMSGALDYNPNDPKASILKSITLVLSQNSIRKMVAPVQITEGDSKHINQEFGFMSAICKAFCDIDIISPIPSEAFFPAPAVTSFVVNFKPKKEKTTIDRILREFFIDKRGAHSSIKRIFTMMLIQGKLYKMNKHKNNYDNEISSKFTSKNIEDKNIYDLTNYQLSQLIVDLIRNDMNKKIKRDYKKPEEEYDEEDEDLSLEKRKSKYYAKYWYLFDSRRYDALMHRGLEKIDFNEFKFMMRDDESENSLSTNRRR